MIDTNFILDVLLDCSPEVASPAWKIAPASNQAFAAALARFKSAFMILYML
jgi:hypothetical protein